MKKKTLARMVPAMERTLAEAFSMLHAPRGVQPSSSQVETFSDFHWGDWLCIVPCAHWVNVLHACMEMHEVLLNSSLYRQESTQ